MNSFPEPYSVLSQIGAVHMDNHMVFHGYVRNGLHQVRDN